MKLTIKLQVNLSGTDYAYQYNQSANSILVAYGGTVPDTSLDNNHLCHLK
ncbi:hypothetical protein [Aquimarina aggregata]|nr:hypothetical protein [Aquimarina aggregata]